MWTPDHNTKTKLNTNYESQFVRINDPKISGPKLAEQVNNEMGKQMPPKTISRILNKQGFKSTIAKKKPFISKHNRKKRLAFARKHASKDQAFWNSILWSDESKFNLFGSDGRVRCWRKQGESLNTKNLIPTVKHGGGNVMIWGCFSSNGAGTHEFVTDKMNQWVYQEILSRNVKTSASKLRLGRRFIFQQDRDPKHTAKSTWEFFKKQKITVLDWPPQSPDLNPIEHLWEHIERDIRKQKITNKDDLKKRISEAFEGVTQEVTQNLVG